MQRMKDKLNIAMLGHKRIPSRESGVEIVVEEFAVRMAKAGHEVHVYNRGGHHVGAVLLHVFFYLEKKWRQNIQMN